MIVFKTITIRNFLSYGNVPTTIILDDPGTTLILGEDLDNTERGTSANGTGKTTLVNALCYSVYDKPLSNISKDNLVNNINKKNMEVVVEFIKDHKHYAIRRVRKAKAGAEGNFVQLFAEGKDITPDNVNSTNALIEQIVGIPYELFVRIVTFSATHVPFLDLPVRSPYAANQTDIIEELFDLKTLSYKADLLKEQIHQTEHSLETHLSRVQQLEKEHQRHSAQIDSAQKRVIAWEQENKKNIHELQEKLKKVEGIDIDHQQELHNEKGEIDRDLRESVSEQQGIEREAKKLTEIITKRKKELVHLRDQKCPYCLQQYADGQQKIQQCEQEVNDAVNSLQQIEPQLAAIDESIVLLTTRRKEVQQQISVSNINELLDIKSKIAVYQQRLAQLQQQTNPYIELLRELQDIKLDPVNMDMINELKALVDHQKFLLKLLTKKDSFVRKALLNKNIPYLNQRLAYYLTNLGLPHTVEFTHEMTASISQFGRALDFGNLSNGQRARVNIALSFAFRDVLQSIHQHINVCMLDEVLDVGLDSVGVQAAAKMLKRKARDEKLSLFVISHRDEIDSAFDKKMIVQLHKGFSTIKFDD